MDITPAMLDQSKKFWYLALISKATKPPPMAWLEPSPIYLYHESLEACTEDLARPFSPDDVDLVAGIDGTGFVLGASIARKLNRGFLMLRKAGHMCVEVDEASYCDYKKTQKKIEMRKNLFPKGTRVLIVDQWIETGGTMKAGIELVQRQGGVVAGIAAICCEPSEGGRQLAASYKASHATHPDIMKEIGEHTDDFFTKLYDMMKK